MICHSFTHCAIETLNYTSEMLSRVVTAVSDVHEIKVCVLLSDL